MGTIALFLLTIMPVQDRNSVREVMDAYVRHWLAGDAAAVTALFADDAVLVPHHGLPAVVGLDAIRKWWWPAGAAPTTIDAFSIEYDQIAGDGSMAFVRGRQKLEWTTNGKRFRNAGNALTVLRKEGGRWRIVLQMWGDPPNQQAD